MVYRYVFALPGKLTRTIDMVQRLPQRSSSYKVSLLLACRQTYQEAIGMFYEESCFRLKLGSPKSLDVPTWRARDEAERLGRRKEVKKKDSSGRSEGCEDQFLQGSSIRVDLWKHIRRLEIYIEKDPKEEPKFKVWYLKIQCWLAVIAVDIFGDSHSLHDLTIVSLSCASLHGHLCNHGKNMFDPLAYLYGIKRFTFDAPLSESYIAGLKMLVTSDSRLVELVNLDEELQGNKAPLNEYTRSVVKLLDSVETI